MANVSNYNYIDAGYDNNLIRSSSEDDKLVPTFSSSVSQSPFGETEQREATKIIGNSLDNLWISTWIKSRNYSPKSKGFYIDGAQGYIECMKLYVGSGGIVGGKIDIPDATTTNSFHVDTTGAGWVGETTINRSTAPIKWTNEGELTVAKLIVTGASGIANFTDAGDLAVLDQVDTAQIVDAAIGEAKLDDSAVTENKIAALAVTTAKIDNLAVTNAKINSLAVSKLTAGVITSKAITLAADSTDCYISGGTNLDYVNWTADIGFMLGIDYSASKAKFFVGDNANDKYAKFDGTDLISSGMVIGQKFTVGENITAGNAVGFGSYNPEADYSETQDDTDYTFHNWVDTYADQDFATTNYLTTTGLLMGGTQAGLQAKELYFYFDMDSIPDYFTAVYLRLYCNAVTGIDASINGGVRNCTSQWNTVSGVPVNRGNLTWNNKPTYSSTVWGTGTFIAGNWISIDITNLVLYWKFGGLTNYGLVVLGFSGSPGLTYATIRSINNGSLSPTIRIDGLEDVGKIYQTSIDSPLSIYNFKGFAYNTATAGNKCLVQEIGIVPNLTGLVANKYYYIHSPDGAITEDTNAVNTFGAQYQVGRASSTTTLLIEKGQKIQTGSISLTTANSYGNIATYFKPTRIEFYRTITGSDITSHGVAYEQAKQMHETKNGSTITTDTTYVYNDATNTMKVICIGQSATLLQKGGAGALTLNYIAYS